MSTRRLLILGGLWFVFCVGTLAVEGRGPCAANCNQQYKATLNYCASVRAKNPGKQKWYNDCVKNAKKFRLECLRRCQRRPSS